MKRLIYSAAFVLAMIASIPSNPAIARGRPPIWWGQTQSPQTESTRTETNSVPTTKKSIGGERQSPNSNDKRQCNQYPLYTGHSNGTSPAPANGTAGPIIPPECQQKEN